MESTHGRRSFLIHCAKAGGACCALLAWTRHLPADDAPGKKEDPGEKKLDLKQYAFCGIPCEATCELYKATRENDVKLKQAVYEKWGMKKTYGIEFDPDKIFCYTCKPGDKPKKIGMAECAVRQCAMENGLESCAQCSHLTACDKEFWKTWPQLYEFTKKLQAKYLRQPGAALTDAKPRRG
jgi:hypothetical protein